MQKWFPLTTLTLSCVHNLFQSQVYRECEMGKKDWRRVRPQMAHSLSKLGSPFYITMIKDYLLHNPQSLVTINIPIRPF